MDGRGKGLDAASCEPCGLDQRRAHDRRGAEDHRFAEHVSLTKLHAQVHEALEVRLGLDSFGDDARVDVRAERQHRYHERASRVAGMHAVNEVAIDLDEVRPNLSDHEHARVPRARVVDRDPETARAQVGHDAPKTRDIGYRHPFADLEDDILGGNGGFLCELRQTQRSVRLRQRRQHHVEEERGRHRVHAAREPCPDAGLVQLLLHRVTGGIEERAGHLGAGARVDPAERLVSERHPVEEADNRLHRRANPAGGDEPPDELGSRSLLVAVGRHGAGHSTEAPPRRAELRRHHLQEGERVESAGTTTPGDEDPEELVAALDRDGDEGTGADLVSQRGTLARRQVWHQRHQRRRQVGAGRGRAPRRGCVDARDRIGAHVETGERLPEDRLNAGK